MNTHLRGMGLGVAAMALVVVASNVLVQFPINEWLTWGALTYPISFLVTDLTNRAFGPRMAHRVVYVGFAIAVVLSIVLATPRIALASGTAFLVAQLLDVQVFNRLQRHAWWKPPFVSSLLGSSIDTVLFFSIAFAATGLPLVPLEIVPGQAPIWVTWAIGDFGVKVLVALAMLIPFRFALSALFGPPAVQPPGRGR